MSATCNILNLPFWLNLSCCLAEEETEIGTIQRQRKRTIIEEPTEEEEEEEREREDFSICFSATATATATATASFDAQVFVVITCKIPQTYELGNYNDCRVSDVPSRPLASVRKLREGTSCRVDIERWMEF
ncbi:hypothetical protein L1049_027307 [Liquidambar formosana]|uniref:Secreted protein n=1 Tax=Liquidambar formosana TaxID=63359 RepID=A0AAP0N5K2_LIQFO